MGHRRQPDEHVGRIVSAGNAGGALELAIDTGGLATGGWHAGDSIYVAGVCLTAARVDAGRFAACVSRETLTCTTLGSLAPGDPVNLEPALAVGDPLGGHYVTGHVDGAVKGSVTLDGVSLTVNELAGDRFGVNLVPHTRAITTPGAVRVGQAVNLEVDILARYLERLLDAQWRR